jgi:hypothetical protein
MDSSGQTPAGSTGDGAPLGGGHDYPLTYAVDYPDRALDRVSTAFRIITIIPIAILAAAVRRGRHRDPRHPRAADAAVSQEVPPLVV